MKIQHLPIESLKPYERNPRKNDSAVKRVAESIKSFGFNQPIVVDKDLVVVVGHTRLKAAKSLELQTVPVLVVDDIPQERLQAYRIADNKLNELAEWDDDLLYDEVQDIIRNLGNADLTGFSEDELNEILGTQEPAAGHSAYTKKVETPVYTPKGECPPVKDLVNNDRYNTLVAEIRDADIPDEVRSFLLTAAERHRVFDYQAIAEYYCHAEPEVQALMEGSALVIIDFNQAIERGYVKLTDELKDIYAESYGEHESE